jgi:putative Holliday junction resolvase
MVAQQGNHAVMTTPARAQIYPNVRELTASMAKGQRLLGLDIGDKTVGVAISDPLFMLASPLKTVPRTKKLGPVIDEIARLAENEDIGGLLAGLPVSMDGTEGPRAQATRDITMEIATRLGLPATFWDERLSTAAIERFLVTEANMTRKRRKDVVDKMAAAYILQGALDSL